MSAVHTHPRAHAVLLSVALLLGACVTTPAVPEPTVAPEHVPAAERGPYFAGLSAWIQYDEGTARGGAALGTRGDTSVGMANGVRLSLLAKDDPALLQQVDTWMIKIAGYMSGVYAEWWKVEQQGPPSPAWREAERDMGIWLNQRLPRLPEDQRIGVARAVFAFDERADHATPYAKRWPGFDAFGWGLSLVDDWMSQGKLRGFVAPPQTSKDEVCFADDDVFDHGKEARSASAHIACDWLRQALSDDAWTPRLAEAMTQRGPAWTATLIRMLEDRRRRGVDVPDRVAPLWKALDGDAAAWTAATRELADRGRCAELDPIAAAIGPPWVKHPERRGMLLYVLLRGYEEQCHAAPPELTRFLEPLGAPDEPLLRAMLDQSPFALPVALMAWPALKPGFSPSNAVLDHLDAFLDRSAYDPRRTLVQLVQRICESHDERGLARLHGYLQERSSRHAAEDVAFGDLVPSTAPGRCQR